MDIQNKDKMLLLLDGYDEVAHLNIRDEFKKLIDKILEYKNVIMTSRPNAVIEEMSNRFERKVENTGWDSEGIEQYVNKNFEYDKELGVQLKSFLDTHSQIKEICEVPINTALICLVWSDKDIRDKFQKNSDEDFNISQLYQEVVIWLGKKYFQKFENERIVNITDGQILSTPELQFLQEIAFEALVNTGKLVTHQLIKAKLDDKNFKTLNIEKINKLGLLKAEETGESIINLNHQFIHLTFQEYLAACYLKNQLADNNTKYKAANFIGKHRNDPKYLMTLKFLAGIVNNDNNQELIEIFWEAVTCNVDGILELGIERKIILLMHLLAQSKINGKFDNRIPNLTQIQNLIDDIVLKDITIWEQHIIDSGYLSEKIIKTVNEKLRKSKTDFQELKASVGIITSLVNRHEWGSKTKVYTRLISLLKVKNKQLKELVLQKLDETIDEKVVRESLNTITLLLNIWELNSCINIILIKVINIMPDLDEELLKQVQKLQNKSLVTTSMIEIVKAIPSLAKEAFKVLKELLNDSDESIKFAVIDGIVEIVKANLNLAKKTFKMLKELLSDDVVMYSAIDSMVKVVKIMHTTEAFDTLKELLSGLDIDNYTHSYVKGEAVRSLKEVVKAMHVESAFKALKELVDGPNKTLKYAAIWSLVVVIEIKPSTTEEVFAVLRELLSDSDKYIKHAAVNSLGKIVKAKSNIAEKVFTILKKVLSNPDSDNYFNSEAAKSIAEIVRANPSMAKEAFSVLKKLINDHNTENFIRCDIASSLAEIVAVIPSEEIIAGLKELLNNPNCYIRYVAVWSLVEIIEIKPNIAIEVFIGIKELIINSNIDNYIRCEAVMNLAGIVEVIPHLEERAYSVLKGLLLNNPYYNEDVKYAAAISLINIINVKSFDKASYKQVNRLINIIALNRTQNFDKELYIEIDAKIVLHKITHHLTQEYEKGKNPEVIEWFNRYFNELPNISETRIFLKEICQSILKSGVINELESKFILRCIKKYNFTFTVSVSKEQEIEGKIIFEDRNYEIFKTDNSARKIVSLEEFATKLLVETDDPLAE